MTTHLDRTRHTYFCPKCRHDFERSEPGKCGLCGLRLAPAGYCAKCRGYWRMRVGQLCPEHSLVLEGESAEVRQRQTEDRRATDPDLEPVVVFEGNRMEATLAQAALADEGIEAVIEEPATDPMLANLEPVGFRVLTPRGDRERAAEVVREFRANRPEQAGA
jgi:predicted Fe-Mo cluster-binding NifX family protein